MRSSRLFKQRTYEDEEVEVEVVEEEAEEDKEEQEMTASTILARSTETCSGCSEAKSEEAEEAAAYEEGSRRTDETLVCAVVPLANDDDDDDDGRLRGESAIGDENAVVVDADADDVVRPEVAIARCTSARTAGSRLCSTPTIAASPRTSNGIVSM